MDSGWKRNSGKSGEIPIKKLSSESIKVLLEVNHFRITGDRHHYWVILRRGGL